MLKKYALIGSVCALCCLAATAWAKDAFYIEDKVKGYDEGSFAVLAGDDVNLRAAPDGRVLQSLPRHTLLKVEGVEGKWCKVRTDGAQGYLFADFTTTGQKDELTEEDFALAYTVLNKPVDVEQLKQSLGPVTEITKKDGRLYYTFGKVTIGAQRRGKLVEYIAVEDPNIISMRGVCIGDSSARLVGQYGVPDAVTYDADKVVYEYFLHDSGGDDYRFWAEISSQSLVRRLALEKVD